jgi:RNA polymerase sigma-70 factor (ECF subfamily)
MSLGSGMNDRDQTDWLEYVGGSNAALDRIQRRHQTALLKYCSYATGSYAQAQDIVQETFLRLINQRSKLTVKTSLADWLFICARNLCFNLAKREKVRESFDADLPGVETTVDQETARFIEQVLGKLSLEERDLILLREQQGYAIGEIALLLSLSEEAVRVRLYRVRRKMQELGKR